VWLKYINGTLKPGFELDTTSKPKPVAGSDDLLLLLTHHWARDESVFPTEDARHDVATIMLFESYTAGRPAEFVHASKGKASQDPLGEAEDANRFEPLQEGTHEDYDDESDAGDDPEYYDEDLFEDDNSAAANDDIDENSDSNSSCDTDEIDVTMIEEIDNCYTPETYELREPIQQNYDIAKLDEHGEAVRKYKALCYEDICLWIVQNPKRGERDVLAMEVHLRYHKGADNKPKPYVAPPYILSKG
jgi:hypothetical protein